MSLIILSIALLFFYVRIRTSWSSILEHEWSHALDFMNDPIYMVDLEDRIIKANDAFYKKIASNEEEAVGKKVTHFTHPEGEEVPCKVCQARKELVDKTIILEADDPANKSNSPVEISVNVIRDKRNKAVAIIQSMRDLSERRKNESMFRGVLDATPDPLIVTNQQGVITIVNSQFEEKFGYHRDEIIGQEVEVLLPDFLRNKHKGLRQDYQAKPSLRPMGINMELVGQRKDGSSIPLEISLSPVTVDNQLFIISSLHDITQRLVNRQELKRLARFPADAPIPIFEIDLAGNITYANPAAEKQFHRIEGISYDELMHEDVNKLFEQLVAENNVLIREIEIDNCFYEQNIIYFPDQQRIHIYSWDITNIHEMSAKMKFHATHDSLTGLPNRRAFEDQLERAIMSASFESKHHILCYMDLDQFKIVNDTCGHIAGDELLRQLSSMLKTHIRDSDVLARLGGDEFGLLLTGCNISIAKNIAEKIRAAVENFRFYWDGKTFKIGVSIGIVPIEKHSGELSDILSAADTACYIAKDRGRNQLHIYSMGDSMSERHTSEMHWIHRIQDALENNHFVLYAQEIKPVATDRSNFYEVLLRMQSENENIISPMAFLTAAERYNIITDIDLWVIRKVLKILSQSERKDFDLSINLSGQTLSNERAMNSIIDNISDNDINPERICFEVTETSMIANLNSAIRFMNTLRGLGCKMALDDFGCGVSSFAYLKNLPVDYLKIDGHFIRNMDNESVNAVMVESIIQIGHKLGLEIVAEYVENEHILKQVIKMGANYLQGYAISKPQVIDNILSKSNSSSVA
ncbi:MAG: EAL domain-containing protein [Gammaproteobacteria bacterium]